jgi:hypothetical protein
MRQIMSMDRNVIKALFDDDELPSRESYDIDGINFYLPIVKSGGSKRVREWQRRVLIDLLPDSINADAPERTPFRLLNALTTSQKAAPVDIKSALTGDLEALEPLFRAETETSQKKMTLAFHVLAVKAASAGELDAKGFTEKTILLLCRDSEGKLNVDLLRRLIEEFRKAPGELDLAQRTLLERLGPSWRPDQEPQFHAGDAAQDIVVPFDPIACKLFQEDLESLLDSKMSPPDFFQYLNQLFILHLGLFQARAATLLNPQMDILEADLAEPAAEKLAQLQNFASAASVRHPFTGYLDCWAATDGQSRRLSAQTPALVSFERIDRDLQRFHFSVLTLVQLRRLAEAYLATKLGRHDCYLADKVDPGLHDAVRTPLVLLQRLHKDSDFRTFINRALTVLCVRFIHHQIAESDRVRSTELLETASSPLEGLRKLYERYNMQTSRNATGSRAYRQGTQVMSSLLSQGEFGLIQGRRGIGRFFEIGAGLLPLLLLLTVTPRAEKVPLERLWKRLEQYGLALEPTERSRLLERLRSMGVYERYSDAGDSAYVRNLMISAQAA